MDITHGVISMDQVARFSDTSKSSQVPKKDDAEFKKRIKELQDYQGER
jgi:hypothetical protein